VLLIGGRNQLAAQSSAVAPGVAPAVAPVPAAADPAVAPADRIPAQRLADDPVQAEIDRALDSYQRGLLEETAVGSYAGVEVHMRLTGDVVDVKIAEHVPVRYDVERMGDLVVRAMQAASAYAAERRAELAEQVTFFGEPALPRVRAMATDPEQAMQEMTAVRYW
jgi:DNA-binding protein YbaB